MQRSLDLCALPQPEMTMSDPVEPLILDLLEWIGPGRRGYAEVLEVWRTSCPRLPVWEEANVRGFIDHIHEQGYAAYAALTQLGLAHLKAHRSYSAPPHPTSVKPAHPCTDAQAR